MHLYLCLCCNNLGLNAIIKTEYKLAEHISERHSPGQKIEDGTQKAVNINLKIQKQERNK